MMNKNKKLLLIGLGILLVVALFVDAVVGTQVTRQKLFPNMPPVTNNVLPTMVLYPTTISTSVTPSVTPELPVYSTIKLKVLLQNKYVSYSSEGNMIVDYAGQDTIITDINGKYLSTLDAGESTVEEVPTVYENKTDEVSDKLMVSTLFDFTEDDKYVLQEVTYSTDTASYSEYYWGAKTGRLSDLKLLVSYKNRPELEITQPIAYWQNAPLIFESSDKCTQEMCEGYPHKGKIYLYRVNKPKEFIADFTFSAGGVSPTDSIVTKNAIYFGVNCCGGGWQYRIDMSARKVVDLESVFSKYKQDITTVSREDILPGKVLFVGRESAGIALMAYDVESNKVQKLSGNYSIRLNAEYPWLTIDESLIALRNSNEMDESEIVYLNRKDYSFVAYFKKGIIMSSENFYVEIPWKVNDTKIVDVVLHNVPVSFDRAEIIGIIP